MSLSLTLNTCFTPFSSVFIVHFEHVFVLSSLFHEYFISLAVLIFVAAIVGFKVTVVQVCFLNTFDNRIF